MFELCYITRSHPSSEISVHPCNATSELLSYMKKINNFASTCLEDKFEVEATQIAHQQYMCTGPKCLYFLYFCFRWKCDRGTRGDDLSQGWSWICEEEVHWSKNKLRRRTPDRNIRATWTQSARTMMAPLFTSLNSLLNCNNIPII